jgi:hypothetical protein
MKTVSKTDGLSARRKHHQPKTMIKRASTIAALIAGGLLVISCDKTKTHETAGVKDSVAVAMDSTHKPNIDIHVNKHYDKNGKIIGFDSTYTSYYSDIKGDTARMKMLFKDFDNYFGKRHAPLFQNDFNRLFFKDSIFYPDFFHNDFFLKRYELNDPYMRRMMKEMDSVKNKFYLEESNKRKDRK